MSKFKAGDNVKCVEHGVPDTTYGKVYKVLDVSEYKGRLFFEYIDDVGDKADRLQSRFELVQEDAVLTPEEVFKHLQRGTKLQYSRKATANWCDHSGVLNRIKVNELLDYDWRIWRIKPKPEPEVIELNGKKYREIID